MYGLLADLTQFSDLKLSLKIQISDLRFKIGNQGFTKFSQVKFLVESMIGEFIKIGNQRNIYIKLNYYYFYYTFDQTMRGPHVYVILK
jgi:hypothetical protein